MSNVSNLTKAQFRDMVLRAADAVNTDRWDATPGGEVDLLISQALDREWRRILNVAPYMRVREHTVTAGADGKYDLTDLRFYVPPALNTNDAERMYRVLGVVRDGTVYREESFKDNIATTQYSAAWHVYWREGDFITLMPIEASATASIFVNHIPPRFTDLTDENEYVHFPEGHEFVAINEAAALMLASKAGAEHGSALELKQIAQEYREDMLSDLARFSTNPTTFRYSDTSFEWGGS